MDATPAPTRLEYGNALGTFVADHDLAMVEFYTEGCPKCGAMEPVLGNVARTTGAAVGLVNPGEDLSLLERFEVTSVPTLVVFVDGEAVVSTAEGFLGTEEVVEFLQEHADESQ